MGKRQRRRDRERAKRKQQAAQAARAQAQPQAAATGQDTAPAAPPAPAPAPAARVLYPGPDEPLLEVHVRPDTPEGIRKACLAYWEFSKPGTWARPVASLGLASYISKAVKDTSHAALLTVLCPDCGEPLTVSNRSEMAATGFWREDSFPTTPQTARRSCQECVRAQQEAREAEAARTKEQQAERDRRRAENASKVLAEEDDREIPEEQPSPLAAASLLAILDIMEHGDSHTFGPLTDLPYTLAGSREADIAALKELHDLRYIAPTFPAKVGDFTYNDDDTVTGFYVAQLPWKLTGWTQDEAAEARDLTRRLASLALIHPAEKQPAVDVIRDLEAQLTVDYLSGLLVNKYDGEPIPEHRLADAYETARQALEDGFSLGQMIAVCWSAASRSVAWGARTSWAGPSQVAAAAVTNMGKGVGYAKDRPVVEYEPPKWLHEPAAVSALYRLLRRNKAAKSTLQALRSLRQRINEHDARAVDLHDELDSLPAQPRDDSRPLRFAVVTPDGQFAVRDATVEAMKHAAGYPYGMVDRIIIDGTRTLDAYIAELADTNVHEPNYAAARMLDFLGASPDPVWGTVAFFQTRPGSHLPHSLDAEHQELLELAYQATRERLSGNL